MKLQAQHREGALPFFLKAGKGERFCLYHRPASDTPARGSILYVHPFAEELNKSRRMAALQARAYARAGYGVLQIDLHGCGDSSGDFGEARWQSWLADLQLAWQWLADQDAGPIYLWGLRLGALLALEFAEHAAPAADGLILWQPVVSGSAHLRQFIRMQNTARLFSAPPQESEGHDMEVAGYLISQELALAVSGADAAIHAPRCPVFWFELTAAAPAGALACKPPELQPASALLVERWRDGGAIVHERALHGLPFWSGVEISTCPALLAATLAAVDLMAET